MVYGREKIPENTCVCDVEFNTQKVGLSFSPLHSFLLEIS